jgi:hypothetical protein
MRVSVLVDACIKNLTLCPLCILCGLLQGQPIQNSQIINLFRFVHHVGLISIESTDAKMIAQFW